MYLKPDPRFQPDPYEFVTVGIQFFKARPDAFAVMAVWKNSPAEAAGIAVGDLILSVNARPSSDLDSFAAQLQRPAGTTVALQVEREGEKLTFKMKTRQLVCPSAIAH